MPSCSSRTQIWSFARRHSLFLGAAWYGKRYGAEALVVAISWLADQGHHRFTLDPNVHNATVLTGDHL